MSHNVSETRWRKNWSSRGTALISSFEDKASKPITLLPPFRVIIAGSRGFDDYELLKEKLDFLLQNRPHVQIISGTANGADKLGEQYAQERGFLLKKMPADWDKYGKRAGYIRNEDMAKCADACVCFWDGRSKGTYHMINLATQYKLKLKYYVYNTKT